MMTVQSTDWATPEAQATFGTLRQQEQMKNPVVWAIFGAVMYGVFLQPDFPSLWGVYGGLLLAFLWSIYYGEDRKRHLRAAQVRGVVTYQFDDQDGVLHVQDALSTTQIERSQRDQVLTFKEGLVIRYAGASTLYVPNGPIRVAIERSLS